MFGVTRPTLRTLVQSIARHDMKFPEISGFRTIQTFIRRSHTLDDRKQRPSQIDVAEGGANYLVETNYHKGAIRAGIGPANIRAMQPGSAKPGLFRSSTHKNTASEDYLTDKPPHTTTNIDERIANDSSQSPYYVHNESPLRNHNPNHVANYQRGLNMIAGHHYDPRGGVNQDSIDKARARGTDMDV